MPKLPDKSLQWPIAWAAVVLIAESESCRLKAYRCPAGVWTVGWGATFLGLRDVRPSDVLTQAEADAQLCADLSRLRDSVAACCTRAPTDNELGALVSLAYNIGLAAFRKSTVLRAHNAGNQTAAARAFGLWNKARVNGALTVLAGLSARRARESALYLTPDTVHDDDHAHAPLPQAVAAESSLARSPIAQSATATTAAGALTLLTTLNDNAAGVKQGLATATEVTTTAQGLVAALSTTFGVTPPVLLAIGLLVAGGVALYWRFKQRAEGYA